MQEKQVNINNSGEERLSVEGSIRHFSAYPLRMWCRAGDSGPNLPFPNSLNTQNNQTVLNPAPSRPPTRPPTMPPRATHLKDGSSALQSLWDIFDRCMDLWSEEGAKSHPKIPKEGQPGYALIQQRVGAMCVCCLPPPTVRRVKPMMQSHDVIPVPTPPHPSVSQHTLSVLLVASCLSSPLPPFGSCLCPRRCLPLSPAARATPPCSRRAQQPS